MQDNQTKQFEQKKVQAYFKRRKQKDGQNGGQAVIIT